MSNRVQAKSARVGMYVQHFLFPEYGIGRTVDMKRGGCMEGGTQMLCEFPNGVKVWLKCSEAIPYRRFKTLKRKGCYGVYDTMTGLFSYCGPPAGDVCNELNTSPEMVDDYYWVDDEGNEA